MVLLKKNCTFAIKEYNIIRFMDALIHIPQQQISTVDALWTLIMSQSKSIQKTLSKRLDAHLTEEKRLTQEKYVRDTLTSAINELRTAEAEGRELPDARLLIEQLED